MVTLCPFCKSALIHATGLHCYECDSCRGEWSDAVSGGIPSHYRGGIEPLKFIESWHMGFSLGNVVKYLCRYKEKNGMEDLLKAQNYLNRYIEEFAQADLERRKAVKPSGPRG